MHKFIIDLLVVYIFVSANSATSILSEGKRLLVQPMCLKYTAPPAKQIITCIHIRDIKRLTVILGKPFFLGLQTAMLVVYSSI